MFEIVFLEHCLEVFWLATCSRPRSEQKGYSLDGHQHDGGQEQAPAHGKFGGSLVCGVGGRVLAGNAGGGRHLVLEWWFEEFCGNCFF